MSTKPEKPKTLRINNKKSVSSGKTETKTVQKTVVKQPKKRPEGTPWKKGQSGNPNGRPRKLVSDIIDKMKSEGVKPLKQSQVSDAYEVLMQLEEAELMTLINDKKTPMFIRIIGKAMVQKDGTRMIETMLDRAHGKSTQKSEIDVKSDGKELRNWTIIPVKVDEGK